ncbi:hypothetical protein V2J09_021828 [Rumex salicifolius]
MVSFFVWWVSLKVSVLNFKKQGRSCSIAITEDINSEMRTDVAEMERTPACSCAVKVHGAICTQLETLIDRISRVYPKIVDSRPRCSSGIQALCQLLRAIETAKKLLKYCSKSSRFYLALKGGEIVSRFKKTKKNLEENLSELQKMVPRILELEISQIVDDLKHTVLIIGSSEHEAAKVLRAILQKDESILSSFGNSQIRALQFVASRIHLTSLKDLLLEREAIQKMLETFQDSEQQKKGILWRVGCLLEKHDKQVLEGQEYYASIVNNESFFPMVSLESSPPDDSVNSSYESNSPTSAFESLDGSFGSLTGLNLQIDISNLSLGPEDSSYNSGDFHSTYDVDLGSYPEFKVFSSKHELEITLLSNISLLPWESQFRAIEDVQSYLDYYNHSPVPLSLKNFVDPLVGFLKAAVDTEDENAQVASIRLLSTGVHVSRSAVRLFDEELYLFLGTFLGTSMTKDVLAIFQSSVQASCGMKLAQSGALTSILKILETQYTEFHKTAIKLLFNLSSSTQDPCLLGFIPLGCIPKLAFFLQDTALSLPSIQIMEKLCCTEEARVLATETKGCIASIVELLDTGNCQEQEHGISILISLCSQCSNCCRLVMEEGIMPTLFCIQVNGSERAKAGTIELLRILKKQAEDEEEEEESYFPNMY